MSILDGLPGILSGAAGDLLFKPATYKRVSARVGDGRGGFTQTQAETPVRAIVTDYSAFMRASGGIPPNERKVLVLGDGLDFVPQPEDSVRVDGRDWVIIEVRTDPAGAVWELRAR